MLKVKFYENIEDTLLKSVIIVSRHESKWVFCKHKERDTYECPGGHREAGENINEAAKRELWEETGALNYDLKPVCVYSVKMAWKHLECFILQKSLNLKTCLIMK